VNSNGRRWDDESTIKGPAPPPSKRLRLDHTHERHQRRIARAVADRLSRILAHNEQVLAFTEGVERTGVLARALQGPGWAPSRRVALMLTDRRLIEIGLSSGGRRALGAIRAFPWDLVPGFEIAEGVLEVRTWADVSYRWYLRDEIDPAIEEKLLGEVDLAVSTYQPTEIRSLPLRYCSHCCAAHQQQHGECTRCGHGTRTARLAGALALAFPGAGYLYANRPLAAALRFAVELLVFGLFAAKLLTAATVPDAVTMVAVGAIVLGVLKIQGTFVARMLAGRADMIRPSARHRWHWLVPTGAAASLAALLLPLALIGAADGAISWDLDVLQPEPEWRGQRVHATRDDPTGRSRWVHREGLEAWVRAEPLRPFESPAAARERLSSAPDGNQQLLHLGPHQAIRSIAHPSTGGEDEVVTVRLTVIDADGRDLHTLSTEVTADRSDAAQQRLEKLLARTIWVAPTEPLGGR
jgi:hypothetical protein